MEFFFQQNLSTPESENEPNRTELKHFGSNRTDPNSNRHFEKGVEPNRTRTGFLKVQSNRTELEPDDLGSVCVYGSSEF
jgi:hypothetical protein